MALTLFNLLTRDPIETSQPFHQTLSGYQINSQRQISNTSFLGVNMKSSCRVRDHRVPTPQIGCKNQVVISVGAAGDNRPWLRKRRRLVKCVIQGSTSAMLFPTHGKSLCQTPGETCSPPTPTACISYTDAGQIKSTGCFVSTGN